MAAALFGFALVAPLVVTYPLFTFALGAALLKAPLERRIALGVAITVGGVILLLAAGSATRQ